MHALFAGQVPHEMFVPGAVPHWRPSHEPLVLGHNPQVEFDPPQ